jgi:hypothetical protein
MPYKGLSSPQWTAGPMSGDKSCFICSIGEDLRGAKGAYSV